MTTLEAHLSALHRVLAARGLAVPALPIAILELTPENGVQTGKVRVTEAQLQAPVAFAERFDVLLGSGPPWINLSCMGVLRGRLVVGVELPRRWETPAQHPSVNFSGPQASVLADKWDAGSVIDLVE